MQNRGENRKRHWGRGICENPGGRFETLIVEPETEGQMSGNFRKTQFSPDNSRSIITYNDSPDVGFNASINPYRGCEHGCAYCYARPTHEYLGFSPGLDFETKILVKENAPQLLSEELASPRWKPQLLALSGVTDPYQPIERKLQLTRRCLEVLARFRNPVGIITKNHLITRDIDLLQELAKYDAAIVYISLSTLNTQLSRKLEPRTSNPGRRLLAIEKLSRAGIPTGVLAAPIIPALTDHELFSIIRQAKNAGATFASYIVLRLPFGLKSLFENWLTNHFPDRKEKVLNRVRELRGGKLYDSNFNHRMTGMGIYARQIAKSFRVACLKSGVGFQHPAINVNHFIRPGQMELNFN